MMLGVASSPVAIGYLSVPGADSDSVTITNVTQDTASGSIYTDIPCRVSGTTTAADGTVVTVTVDGESAGTTTAASGTWAVDFIVTAAMVPAAGSGNPATVEASTPGASDTTSVDVTTESATLLGWWDPSDASTLSFDGSGDVNGVADKYNSYDVTWDAGSGASTGVPTATVNGLTVLDWPGHSDARRLFNASVALVFEHLATACRYDGSLPFDDFRGLVTGASGGASVLGYKNFSQLYDATGYNHWIDGVDDPALNNAWHLIESYRNNSTITGIVFGSDRDSSNRGWNGPQGETLAWDIDLSSAAQGALLDYYQTKWGTP